jgi:hypothetical protein
MSFDFEDNWGTEPKMDGFSEYSSATRFIVQTTKGIVL